MSSQWDGTERRQQDVGQYEREIGELKATLGALGEAVKEGFGRLEKKIDDNIRTTNDEIERIQARLENFKVIHDQADRDKFNGVYERLLKVEERQATFEAWTAAKDREEETRRKEREAAEAAKKKTFWGTFTGDFGSMLSKGINAAILGGIAWLVLQYAAELLNKGGTP